MVTQGIALFERVSPDSDGMTRPPFFPRLPAPLMYPHHLLTFALKLGKDGENLQFGGEWTGQCHYAATALAGPSNWHNLPVSTRS